MRATRATVRHIGRSLVVTMCMLLAACGGGADPGPAPADAAAGPSSSAATAPRPGGARSTGHAYAAPDPSPGCQRDGRVAPGTREAALRSGGLDRTYRFHVPVSYRPGRPAPLVLELHGLASPIALQALVSGFDAKAEAEGIIHVMPEGGGPGPGWNATGYAAWPDDVAFVADLLDRLEAELCVDRRREFAIGMSNGAHMAARLACDLSDRLAAFALVAALRLPEACQPVRAVPLVGFIGTEDPILPPEGGVGPEVTEILARLGPDAEVGYGVDALGSVEEAAVGWAHLVGCLPEPVATEVSAHVALEAFPECDEDAEVLLYVVEGGGHTWPGSEGSAAVGGPSGATTDEIVANDLLWSFFTDHPRPG